MGAEGAVSGAAGSAAVSSAGAAGAAMQRALPSRSGWEQTAARQTQRCSPPQRMQSRFSGSPYYFSSFPFWCCGPHRSRPPTAELTAPRQAAGWDASRAVVPKPPTAMARAITAEATIWPAARRVFFFGVPVSFCLIPLALPPSCILTRPLAARGSSNAIYTSIVYTQPQAPVNVLRCLVRAFCGSFPQQPTFHVENEPSRRIIASKRKKFRSERDFCVFLLLS